MSDFPLSPSLIQLWWWNTVTVTRSLSVPCSCLRCSLIRQTLTFEELKQRHFLQRLGLLLAVRSGLHVVVLHKYGSRRSEHMTRCCLPPLGPRCCRRVTSQLWETLQINLWVLRGLNIHKYVQFKTLKSAGKSLSDKHPVRGHHMLVWDWNYDPTSCLFTASDRRQILEPQGEAADLSLVHLPGMTITLGPLQF